MRDIVILAVCLAALALNAAGEVYIAPLSHRKLSPNETESFRKARRRLGDKDTLYQLEPLYGSVRDNGCGDGRRHSTESPAFCAFACARCPEMLTPTLLASSVTQRHGLAQ